MGRSSNYKYLYTRSSWVPFRLIFHTHEKAVLLFRNVTPCLMIQETIASSSDWLLLEVSRLSVHVNMSEKCRSVTETSDFLGNRGYSGLFQKLQLPLYLPDTKVLCYQTSQSSWFILSWEQVKRPAFKHKGITVWQLAFCTRKVLGTLEKQIQGPSCS